MLSISYLHDDATSWRHVVTSKTGCTLSQLVEVLERWFFCFYSYSACLVWKCYLFCVCMMRLRHDVTSCQKTHFFIYQLVDVQKWWCTCISVDISVAGFQVIIVCVLAWCLHVITWRYDVIKITTWRQETNCLHISKQICSRADSISVSVIWFVAELNLVIVIVFAWWNNVPKWRHDVTKHALHISVCRRARKMILLCF